MEELSELCRLQHDLFSTAEAAALGVSKYQLGRFVGDGSLVRVRPGYYTLASVWRDADPVARHLLLAKAVLRAIPGTALSHVSGAVALGVETWRPDLREVHLTRLDHRHGAREHGVVHHECRDPRAALVVVRDGLRIVDPTVAIAGAMTTQSLEQAVVTADSGLRRGLADHDQLLNLLESWGTVPGSRTARLAARLMDGDAGSIGESRLRYVAWAGRLRRPELQGKVRGPGGRVAYGDLCWREEKVIAEFDGEVKYRASWREGESASDVVIREKDRENWLTELGWIVRRVTWAELSQPRLVVDRIQRALDLGRQRGAGPSDSPLSS